MKRFLKKWVILLPLLLSVLVFLTIMLSQSVASKGTASQLRLGNKFLSEANYKEAILEFTKAITVDSKNPDAYIGLADAYTKNGQSELAIKILEDFNKKYKDNDILEKLTDIYILNNRYVEANSIVNSLIKETDDEKYYEKQEEIIAKLNERAVPIAFAKNYLLFIKEASLYGMGGNLHGELGGVEHLGNNQYIASSPIKLPLNISSKSVEAGSATSYVVDDSGNVWTSGLNLSAQQGSGSAIQNPPVFTQLSGVDSILSVSASSTYAMALKNDGSVWGMGNNTFNQLGGSQRIISTPTKIAGLSGIISVHTTTRYSLSLKSNGKLYALGILPDGRSFSFPSVIEENVTMVSAEEGYFAFVNYDGKLIINGNIRADFDETAGTVLQTSKGIEFSPIGYSIAQLETSGDMIGLLSQIGEIILFSPNGSKYTLPQASRIYLGEDKIAIVDDASKLRLFGLKDGVVSEKDI